MSFPRYPEYMDSGVEWLGEVPAHWQVQRLSNLFRQVAEDGRDDLPVLTVSIHSGVSDKEFDDNELDRKVTRIEDRTSYKRVAPGDLVYNMMRAWQGGFGTVTVAGLVSPAYVVARPIKHISTFLVEQQLRTPAAVEEMRRHSRGVTDFRLRLYWEEFKTLSVVVPPPIEEAAIAAFLDRETAKIDALVAEQQNLIALLKEKRQALISYAVTKGLDSDVPMKDSGVAWLGEVPAHWTLTKLKYSTSHIIDCPHETPTYCPDGDYLVVRTADVDAGALDLSNAYRLDEVEYLKRTRRAKLVPQDIVYGREGERWGYAATVPDEPVLCLGQRMMQFRARAGIAPRFLMWQLNSDVTYRQGQVDTVGATSPHVNVSTIANYVLTEPPFSEQGEIANYVDGATSEIDDLVSEARSTVELLQERRTALISAAVTGKIDVRHLAVASADRTPEPA